jgi:hypothetical protein
MYTDAIYRLHQENHKFLRAQNRRRPISAHMRLAYQVEGRLKRRLEAQGYQVYATPHNCPFDLWVAGVRVEVKASRWYEHKRGGRYQANIRQHEADYLVFDCINGTDHYFVIPMAALGSRRSLEICSHDPADYGGQWAGYLENWSIIYQAVTEADEVSWQPPLF